VSFGDQTHTEGEIGDKIGLQLVSFACMMGKLSPNPCSSTAALNLHSYYTGRYLCDWLQRSRAAYLQAYPIIPLVEYDVFQCRIHSMSPLQYTEPFQAQASSDTYALPENLFQRCLTKGTVAVAKWRAQRFNAPKRHTMRYAGNSPIQTDTHSTTGHVSMM
jgi:hypothetical protein